MMQQAAIGLGVPLRLLAEAPETAAAQAIADVEIGDYRDLATLAAWAKGCDVVTFDHEHVPTRHLEALTAAGVVCRPGPAALVHAQDKIAMRTRLADIGVACPRWRVVDDGAGIDAFAREIGGYPVVVKTPRGGYDGKGVWTLYSAADSAVAFAEAAAQTLLVEEHVDFARELSAIVVRSPSGQAATYPVVETIQRDGVCVEVTAPAPALGEESAVDAQRMAMTISAELDVVGVLAVELFETRDGRVLVNELAMRPHNTGHWSIDGAVTSQFENHLRAVLDLPLGEPTARAPWCVMVNILGGSAPTLYDGYPHALARDPAVRVHLYGKQVRAGRKVGHVTAYGADLDDVRERARHAAHWFEGRLDDEGGRDPQGQAPTPHRRQAAGAAQ
jgi:5-(carboxyamino)imidazole ribonucleotide synthase